MKVLHLNTLDSGGAARAAYNLHENLLKAGIQSTFLVKYKSTKKSDVFQYNRTFKQKLIGFIHRKLSLGLGEKFHRIRKYCFYDIDHSSSYSYANSIVNQLSFEPNVIILHWVTGFISSKEIYRLQKITGAKLFWYLMDMAPMTGGCHYAWNCNHFQNLCESCPAIDPSTIASRNFSHKSRWLNQADITIISGSSHLHNQVKQSGLFQKKISKLILLGINSEIFKPAKDSSIKESLNIPEQNRVIFFGAEHEDDKRKGISYLKEAIIHLTKENDVDLSKIVFMIAGKNRRKLDLGISEIHLGYLESENELARAYQIADLFVCPSVEDSGPMMINQSIMCGTPVVSFDMGVAKDLVVHEKTGYKVPLYDTKAMANSIMHFLQLDDTKQQIMSANCRELGLEKTSSEVQAKFFIDLF